MIPRRMLEDIFATLPALLVTRLNVDADSATAMADNCIVSDLSPQEHGIWVYVSLPNTSILSNYRLEFSKLVPGKLERIQKLRQPPGGKSEMRWETIQ